MANPERKSNRLKNYDYSQNGAYFITICTKEVSGIVRSFKTMVTKQLGQSIFQRSFFDHIIRNEQDYIEHLSYIENNPKKSKSGI